MNYAPLGWYEQEYLRCKSHFEALPRAPWSLRLFALKVSSPRCCLSVIQAGTPVHKTHNSAITIHRVHLATAYVGLKECAVTKEFCWHSLAVVNACSTILHVNANLKFPICQHKMQVTPIKLSKFISIPKILKANQMLISCFPHITVNWRHILKPFHSILTLENNFFI